MAELDAIAETLRKRRKDLEDLMDDSDSRGIRTAELLAKIEELRLRAEETRRRFDGSVAESRSAERPATAK